MNIPQSVIAPFNIIGIPKIDISVHVYVLEGRLKYIFEELGASDKKADSYSIRLALEMMAELHDGVDDVECSTHFISEYPKTSNFEEVFFLKYNLFGTPQIMRLTKSCKKSGGWE